MAGQTSLLDEFNWLRQPEAAAFVGELILSFCERSAAARTLSQRMLAETGTRLVDWIDHLALPASDDLAERLDTLGFRRESFGQQSGWTHHDGLFPSIVLHDAPVCRLAVKVESVVDFTVAHAIVSCIVEGEPASPLRLARIDVEADAELWVIERHGRRGFEPPRISAEQLQASLTHRESFRTRNRTAENAHEGFDHASSLIRSATGDLGVDWACDLFFAAEREYWQSRSRAARVQKTRQDALGLGWANHDHHTYRSSREHFTKLVAALEQLGFVCRERFYGGGEAGWGAQVLQQPACGITIFADVDLSAEEVTGDFAHEGLAPRDQLGTVGLWCRLHGEAFLQAGLHHLECQYDFDAAREQLRQAGVQSMEPFTDFPYLRQCFTDGEVWPVNPSRIVAALADGFITREQGKRFRKFGAVGSHLEILQRDDGYKGFNQTGISEIITKTDPRRLDPAQTPPE